MIEFLFQKIPELLFPPVAIFGFAGLLISILMWKKQKSDSILAFFAVISIYILLFRVIVQVSSSRYALILIGFAIPYAIWIISPRFTRYLGVFQPKAWSFLLLFCLIVACCGKLFRTEDNYFLRGMDALKRSMQKNPDHSVTLLYPDGKDFWRIRYYTGAENVTALKYSDMGMQQADFLKMLDRYEKPLYLIFTEKNCRVPSEIEKLLENDPQKKWEIVYQSYTNRRKKDRFTILLKRETPPMEVPSLAGRRQEIQNGNFEISAGEKEKDAMREIFANSCRIPEMKDEKWDIPAHWGFDCSPVRPCDFFFEKTKVLDHDGKESEALHLRGNDLSLYFRYLSKIPLGEKKYLSFYAKGIPHSQYIITFFVYNRETRMPNVHYWFGYHNDSNWHRRQIVFDSQTLRGGDTCFLVLHFLSGDVYFDDFILY